MANLPTADKTAVNEYIKRANDWYNKLLRDVNTHEKRIIESNACKGECKANIDCESSKVEQCVAKRYLKKKVSEILKEFEKLGPHPNESINKTKENAIKLFKKLKKRIDSISCHMTDDELVKLVKLVGQGNTINVTRMVGGCTWCKL